MTGSRGCGVVVVASARSSFSVLRRARARGLPTIGATETTSERVYLLGKLYVCYSIAFLLGPHKIS